MSELYNVLKGRAYGLASVTCGSDNAAAQTAGFKDLFDLLMSDSDHPRQMTFLMMLPEHMPSEGHRVVLLDGLAREYAGLPGWMAYVSRETD